MCSLQLSHAHNLTISGTVEACGSCNSQVPSMYFSNYRQGIQTRRSAVVRLKSAARRIISFGVTFDLILRRRACGAEV